MTFAPRRHLANPTPLQRKLFSSPRSAARFCSLLVCTLSLVACGPKASAPAKGGGPAEVGVITLQAQAHTFTTELPGRTSAYLSAEVRPQVGGILQKRLFPAGAEVKAGQVLYQIDPVSLEVHLAAA